MNALDTNVLVRFLVQDDMPQALAVKRLFEDAENNHVCLWVSELVVLELLWVLYRVYGYERPAVIEAVNTLVQLPVLDVEHTDTVQEWLSLAAAGDLEMDDLLIGLRGRKAGCAVTLSFDRKACRSPLFRTLPDRVAR